MYNIYEHTERNVREGSQGEACWKAREGHGLGSGKGMGGCGAAGQGEAFCENANATQQKL